MVGKKRGHTSRRSNIVSKKTQSSKTNSFSQSNSLAATKPNNIATLQATLERIESQQLKILANQSSEKREIRQSEQKIEESEQKLEEDIVDVEAAVPKMDEKQELTEFKRLEDDLKKGAEASPLKRITYRDVSKGIVGAFIAVVNQFAFASGFLIAEHYSIAKSTLLFLTSFFIIVLFIYYTGFRKVDDKFVWRFLPLRAAVLYLVAIFVSTIVPFFFNTLTLDMPFPVIYGTVASISVLAVLGAGAADLIGKG